MAEQSGSVLNFFQKKLDNTGVTPSSGQDAQKRANEAAAEIIENLIKQLEESTGTTPYGSGNFSTQETTYLLFDKLPEFVKTYLSSQCSDPPSYTKKSL